MSRPLPAPCGRTARATVVALGLAWAALMTGLPAHAATPIFRCGQTYSQTPCPGGRLLEASDPRSAAQRAEARRTAAREKALAEQLARERRAAQAASAPVAATGFDARPPAPGASAQERTASRTARHGHRTGAHRSGRGASAPTVYVAPTPPVR